MNGLISSWQYIRKNFNIIEIILIISTICLAFFTDNNWVQIGKNQNEINQLQTELRTYKDKIKLYKRQITELQSSNKDLEKFAREEYLMKKENEEIFLLK